MLSAIQKRFSPHSPTDRYFARRRSRRLALLAAGLAALPVTGSLRAQPMDVVAYSARYSTYVMAMGDPVSYPPLSRNTVGSSPFSDEIEQSVSKNGVVIANRAVASAALLNVSVQAGWGVGGAAATNQLCFSPLSDRNQAIGIQVTGGPRANDSGSIGLVDLTANSAVWSYDWSTIPWERPFESANFDSATNLFLASHQYELIVETSCQAADDTEFAQIQLSGIQVVPEPSSLCLLSLALLSGLARGVSGRRRGQRRGMVLKLTR